jgi:hypothetical protein
MCLLAGETGACLRLLTDGLFSPLALAGRAPVHNGCVNTFPGLYNVPIILTIMIPHYSTS